MISIGEARARILCHCSPLDSEAKHPLEALGQVLDEDLCAEFDIPPLANSAMDGYAVRAAATAGARLDDAVVLRVIGEVAAGYVFDGVVGDGEAVRIMTGAPVPAGADAVVPFEDTDESLWQARPKSRKAAGFVLVDVFRAVCPGANVRLAGEDVRSGETVVRRGTVLRPPEVGVIASLGRAILRVIRRPVVAILSTGDELLEPGQPRFGSRIYDSNAWGIAAMVTRFGGIPRLMGIAQDNVEALTAAIHDSLDADLLVTSAGVSRGDFDVVKDVLAREGQIDFCSVAMKPGKPLAFGYFEKDGRRVPHIGLPGNPVSSMVAFELFGRPAILKMMGKTDFRRPVIRAICEDRISNCGDPRVFFARCTVTERDGRAYARLTGAQGSGMLTSMIQANALAVVPADVDVVEPGDEVNVLMLDWSRGEDWGSYASDSCL